MTASTKTQKEMSLSLSKLDSSQLVTVAPRCSKLCIDETSVNPQMIATSDPVSNIFANNSIENCAIQITINPKNNE